MGGGRICGHGCEGLMRPLTAGCLLTILETGTFSSETPWRPSNFLHPVTLWNEKLHVAVQRERLEFSQLDEKNAEESLMLF